MSYPELPERIEARLQKIAIGDWHPAAGTTSTVQRPQCPCCIHLALMVGWAQEMVGVWRVLAEPPHKRYAWPQADSLARALGIK